MWRFVQKTGELFADAETGVLNLAGTGYSGNGDGKNNPAMQSVRDVGPIPSGFYRIGPPFDSEAHGPHVMTLTPLTGTDTFERSGFLMHGDSKEHPGAASEGCIVMSRQVRNQVSESTDTLLKVESGLEAEDPSAT